MKLRNQFAWRQLLALGGIAVLALSACSNQKTNSERTPSQWNGGGDNRGNDNGRGDGRGDGRGNGYGNGNDDRRGNGNGNGYGNDDRRGGGRGDDRRGGPGSWRDRNGRDWNRRGENDWHRRGDRRCLGCLDRFNDVVVLGPAIPLYSSSFPTAYDNRGNGYSFGQTVCGIRSVSMEVLDNEAGINAIEVHYAGDGSYNWDRLPLQDNWEFRNAAEGENSRWFDVGSPRMNDRSCIDGIRVTGQTYKDFYDYDTAKVQAYGSRTVRGVGGGGGYGPGYGGPGPGSGGYIPQPLPPEVRRVRLEADVNCIARLPEVPHPDKMISDGIFDKGPLGGCSQRGAQDVSSLTTQGFTCNEDLGARPNQQCVNGILSKIKGGTITRGHRAKFDRYCSDLSYTCTRPR